MSIPDVTPTGNDVAGTINIPILARVCDDVRATILSQDPPGVWPHLQDLCGLINTFLADEEMPKMHVDLDTIRSCRLDRLVEDILEPDHHLRKSKDEGLYPHLTKITYKLQKKWEERFKGEYEKLDDIRIQEMMSMGRLHRLEFRLDGQPRWVPKKDAWEGHATSLEPGMWFLNTACAKRHGIEGESVDDLTINGMRVLPLLWGTEESVTGDLVKYTREGRDCDMMYSLLTAVGRSNHLLRGYQLRGPYSPSAGLRYDGIYNLRSYSLKRDTTTNILRVTLTGDRAPDQTPFETIKCVPRPAELDDWRLCGVVEKRAFDEAGRGDEYADWKRAETGDGIWE